MIERIKHRLFNTSPVAKATLAFVICNILQKGVTFLTTPFFTRLMSTEQYGQFTLYQSWLNIILVFATLKISSGVYHKGLIEYSDDKNRFISSMEGLSTATTITVAVLYIILKPFLDQIVKLPDVVVLFIFVELLTEPAYTFWAANQRHQYKYKALLAVTLVMTILQPAISLFAVYSTEEKGLARIISVSLFNTVVGLIFYIYLLLQGKALFVKKYWKYALAFNLPLVPHYLSNIILAQSDRIMIANIYGESDAAVYALVYQVSMAMTLITNAINSTLMPWVFQKCKAGKFFEIKKYGNYLVMLVGVITLIPAFLGPEVIKLFGGEKYAEGVWLVPPVALSVFFIFLYYLFVYIEYYYTETKFTMISTVSAAILNITLNFLLLPVFGYRIAAYTTVVSYIVYVIAHYYFMKKTLKKNGVTDSAYNGKLILLISVLICIASEAIMATYAMPSIIRYFIIVLIIIGTFVNRKKIISIYRSLKTKESN